MTDYVDDSLVEKLWTDLDGQVSRQQIARAVIEIAVRFEKVTVTEFVPVFIHRQALEHLRREAVSESHPVAGTASMNDDEWRGRVSR